MKLSIRLILLVTAVIAVAMAFAPRTGPMDHLRQKKASFGKQQTGFLYLLAFPGRWAKCNYIDEHVTSIDDVELVSFPANSGIGESDFRNFENFPNLKGLSIHDRVPVGWLIHLEGCPKLAVLCLTKTPAEDEIVECLKSMESLRFVDVSGDRIIVDPEWRN